MTHRQCLALEFVMVFLAVRAEYGRASYNDFRVRAARRRYRAVCACLAYGNGLIGRKTWRE